MEHGLLDDDIKPSDSRLSKTQSFEKETLSILQSLSESTEYLDKPVLVLQKVDKNGCVYISCSTSPSFQCNFDHYHDMSHFLIRKGPYQIYGYHLSCVQYIVKLQNFLKCGNWNKSKTVLEHSTCLINRG